MGVIKRCVQLDRSSHLVPFGRDDVVDFFVVDVEVWLAGPVIVVEGVDTPETVVEFE